MFPPGLLCRCVVLCVAWLLGASAAVAADDAPGVAPPPPSGVTAEGAAFQGALAEVVSEPSWSLRFAGPDGPRELPLDDLATWGAMVEPKGGTQLVLAGGGVLVVDRFHIDGEHAIGTSALFESLRVPLKSLAGVVFQMPADRQRGDRLLARILSLAGEDDRVILDNGDELSGTILAFDGTKLRLQAEAGELSLDQGKLAAMIFNPVLVDQPRLAGLRLLCGFADGSRATAISLVAAAGRAQLKLAGGVELSTSTEALVALQPLGGRVEYLSDLKPSGYRHIPFLELSWPYHEDHSVDGSLLRAGGKLYAKGLGMHSPARISYDLQQSYQRFDAELAIDSEAGPRGSVVFRVFVDDGDGTWQERARSEVVRGGQPPVRLSADLSGARRLSLLVDYADHGDECDHADWLNARLVR